MSDFYNLMLMFGIIDMDTNPNDVVTLPHLYELRMNLEDALDECNLEFSKLENERKRKKQEKYPF